MSHKIAKFKGQAIDKNRFYLFMTSSYLEKAFTAKLYTCNLNGNKFFSKLLIPTKEIYRHFSV